MTMIVANTIPKDLFPLKENQYSLSWATKTYPYAHLFALPFDHKLNPNNDHVSMWRSKAIQLRAELTSIGKDKGTGKILEIANIQYNLKIKGTDLPCSSIYDVLTIVSEKDWYNLDKPTRINQIYMMVYGITRQGFDQWLVEFDLTTTTYSTTELLQDEEVVVLEIDPGQIGTPEELGMGRSTLYRKIKKYDI